jgi:hypothetical protein
VTELYIVSLNERDLARRHRYIMVWRPDSAGYAYPLSWAGRYTREEVRQRPSYLNNGETTIAVPCAVLDELAEAPQAGLIDNDAGPVVKKSASNLRLIKAARWLP